jgi:uncharacterized membrane protein
MQTDTENPAPDTDVALATPPADVPPGTMADTTHKKMTCAITGKERAKRDLFRVDTLRPTLADRIRQDHPELTDDALVSRQEVARFRNLYVEDLLKTEHGEFSELEKEVAESIAAQDTISENTEDDFDENRTLGERCSDVLASFGGSWAFLISFAIVLVVWMGFNVIQGESKAFDAYPFILLNLVLSCIAAIQAPIIMMSQKRQEAKDRLRSLNDYQVNLKAELEIRHLHEKIDYLITKQWQRLAEIQQIQLEIMLESRKAK